MKINIEPIKNNDDATPQLFNSRFNKLADAFNSGLDSDNLADGAVTTTKIANASITEEKLAPEQDWQAVTYQNAWVTYDTTWGGAEYYKDATGVVHMRGLVKNGTVGQPIFTLPAGYRPSVSLLFAVESAEALGRVDVRTNGEVVAGTGSNSWFSLANVKFRAEA